VRRIRLQRRAGTITIPLVVAVMLAACHPAPPLAGERGFPTMAGIFTGTVPCGDCAGIRTDIALVASAPAPGSEGMFTLVEHYLGTRTGDRAVRAQGRWMAARGSTRDADDIVYQLTTDDGGRVVQLRRIDADTVRLIADDRRTLPADGGYILRRPGASLLGGYREVDASEPDVRAVADYAVQEQSTRTGTAVSLRRVLWAARQVVAGVRFRMCVEVAAAGTRSVSTAVVFRTLDQQLSLSEWIDGCEPVPPP
jgi:hypothetical protein